MAERGCSLTTTLGARAAGTDCESAAGGEVHVKRLFLDLEFTQLSDDAKLISLALVSSACAGV